MLAREACRRTILVHGRRSYGKRAGQRGDRLRNLIDGLRVTRGYCVDQLTGKGNPGRHGEAFPGCIAKAHGFRPVEGRLLRLLERNDLLHPSTVTSPAFPSTRTRTPSGINSVA